MSQDATSFFRGISAKISAAKQSYSSSRARRHVEEEEEEPQQPITPPPPSTISSSPQPSSAPYVATSVVGTVSKAAMTDAAGTTVAIGRSSSKVISAVMTDDSGGGGGGGGGGGSSSSIGGGYSGISMQSEQISSMLMTQVQQMSRPLRRDNMSLAGNMFLQTGRESAVGSNGASSGSNSGGGGGGGGGGTVHDKSEETGNTNINNIQNNNMISSSGSGSNGCGTGARPKVHVSALLVRTRKIQEMPKNTSPIVAKNHASLLPLQIRQYYGKKTLILDLDETLVHSSLTHQPKHHDLVLSIKTETSVTTVYVAYRPFLHEFLQAVAGLFEVVIFTASVSMYCNPVMDAVDPEGILGPLRLYREHCSILNGAYVKDLSLLGRDLSQVAIVDNSPVTYLFQQRNAIPIPSWFDDPKDSELKRLIPVLEALAQAAEVYDVLDQYNAVLQLQQEQMRAENN